MLLGLAKNVAMPSPILAAKFNGPGPAHRPRPAGRTVIPGDDVSLAPRLQPVQANKAD